MRPPYSTNTSRGVPSRALTTRVGEIVESEVVPNCTRVSVDAGLSVPTSGLI